MKLRRLLAGILGVALFAVAFLATTNAGLASALPIDALVATLGNDYLLLVVVAAIAAFLTLAVTVSARNSARNHVTPPEAEQVTSVPLAGDMYNDLFTNSALWALTHRAEHETAKRQLTATMVRLIQSETGCTQAEANARIQRGTWTDDPYAAHFLGSRAELGPMRWLTTFLRLETMSQRGARHAAKEVVRRTGGGGRVA